MSGKNGTLELETGVPPIDVAGEKVGESPKPKRVSWGELTRTRTKDIVLNQFGGAVITIRTLGYDEVAAIQVASKIGTEKADRELFAKLLLKQAVVEPPISDRELASLARVDNAIVNRIIEEAATRQDEMITVEEKKATSPG